MEPIKRREGVDPLPLGFANHSDEETWAQVEIPQAIRGRHDAKLAEAREEFYEVRRRYLKLVRARDAAVRRWLRKTGQIWWRRADVHVFESEAFIRRPGTLTRKASHRRRKGNGHGD